MKILALTCNHCGAPLEVPAKTRFLTCTFCSSQLEVHRSGNAAYTEVLKAFQEQAEQVADDVETLKLKRELDELDRKWIEERKRHVRRSGGVPTEEQAGCGLVLGVVLGISTIVAAIGYSVKEGAVTQPALLVLLIALATLLIGIGVFAYFEASRKFEAYDLAKRSYEGRRREILQKIEAIREKGNES